MRTQRQSADRGHDLRGRVPRAQRTPGATAGCLVGVAVMTMLFVALPAPMSFAVDCGPHINVQWYQSDAQHRGDKVTDMSVWDQNNPDNAPNGNGLVGCARVSTLLIFNGINQQMEIGWDIIPDASGPCPIDMNHPQKPVFVIVRTSQSGGQFCEYDGTPILLDTSVTHSFKETDPNHDGNWKFYLDGSLIGKSPHTMWIDGWVQANGERHTNGDSAHSKFVGLSFIDGSGQHAWNNSILWADCDTYYDGGLISSQSDQVLMQNTNSGFTYCA
jgi:hypothetical protein